MLLILCLFQLALTNSYIANTILINVLIRTYMHCYNRELCKNQIFVWHSFCKSHNIKNKDDIYYNEIQYISQDHFGSSENFSMSQEVLVIALNQCIKWKIHQIHKIKSVCIRSYSGPYFPAFGLNTDQNNSEYGHFSGSD